MLLLMYKYIFIIIGKYQIRVLIEIISKNQIRVLIEIIYFLTFVFSLYKKILMILV